MDSTTENDYFELEPYDQYRPQEVYKFFIKIVLKGTERQNLNESKELA
jgi:hypothetical protein